VSVWQREPWGTTRDGEPVELFTIERGALRARLTNFGATLVSLELPDRHGERADVVLGFDTPAEYESEKNPYFGGIVGRCANRIADARFALDGREVRLNANEGRHHLHGGARGFDRRAWTPGTLFELGVAFRLLSPDGEEGYPGALECLGCYALDSRNVGVLLRASASAPTICNLTQHAYFNLAGGGTILDHELEISASRYVVVDEDLIPTGEITSVADTPFDFREPCAIGARIGQLADSHAGGYDVCYALDSPGASLSARLRDPRSGRTLSIYTDAPGLQLYTGNHLGGITGKRGVPYPRFGGVCLEPQLFPDAVHHRTFPSTVLRPGEVRYTATLWMTSAD
jgi:aldose 1-epimerase